MANAPSSQKLPSFPAETPPQPEAELRANPAPLHKPTTAHKTLFIYLFPPPNSSTAPSTQTPAPRRIGWEWRGGGGGQWHCRLSPAPSTDSKRIFGPGAAPRAGGGGPAAGTARGGSQSGGKPGGGVGSPCGSVPCSSSRLRSTQSRMAGAAGALR